MWTYYEARAPEYDDVYEGGGPAIPEPDAFRRDVAAVRDACAGFGRGHLIDIGCGTGYWFPHYAHNCTAITLIDQSRAMLLECRSRVAGHPVRAEVHFIMGDFFDVRFLSRVYDAALVSFLISHLGPEREEIFFSKLAGIMKPGAEVLWVDGAWSRLRARYRVKSGRQSRTLRDGRSFDIYKRYFEETDIRELIRKYRMTLRSLYMGDVFFAARVALAH